MIQPEMFNGSRVFTHSLVIKHKRGQGRSPQTPEARGSGGGAPSAFGDLLLK